MTRESPVPAVTIGVPVRNGAATLDAALETLRGQTFADLRVVVCDNASTDGTAEIITRFEAMDPRFVGFRRETPVSAWENFRSAYEQATGPFFLWAAHDDLRSHDYVERLVEVLLAAPQAVLAFGELVPFSEPETAWAQPAVPYPCSTVGLGRRERLRNVILSACAEVYGVYRTEALRRYAWPDLDVGPDHSLLAHVVMTGDIVQVTGPRFLQWLPERPKAAHERARDNSYRSLRRFPFVRLSWACARAAADAGREAGRPIVVWRAFFALYVPLRWSVTKTRIFGLAPPWAVALWRRIKSAPVTSPVGGGTPRAS